MKWHSSYLLVVGSTALLVLAACTPVVQGPANTPQPLTAAVTTLRSSALPAAAMASAVATPSSAALPVAATSTALPAIVKLSAPPEISCFMSDVTSRVDRSGAVFWNSQCKNNRGQIVFRTDTAGTTVALVTGQGGRGSLDIGPDGRLYITVSDLEQIHAFRLPVPSWQP